MIFGAAYVPHEGSDLFYDVDEFDIISQDILLLKSKYDCAICLCGDLNARTGCLTDFFTIDDVIR